MSPHLRLRLLASFGLLLSACAAVSSLALETRVHRIGFLHVGPSAWREAFTRGLRAYGYVEGQNIMIEYRSAAGNEHRFSELVAELIESRVHILVIGGTQAIRAAQQQTTSIPIVMAVSGDALASGFVESLARPGRNITGMTLLQTAMSAKRLELLKEVLPETSRAAVLWNPTNPASALSLNELQAAAEPRGIAIHSLAVEASDALPAAFESAKRERVAAILVVGDTLMINQGARIAALAAENGLPTMYDVREPEVTAALMIYGPDIASMHERSASYVDKILKGAKPSELPVEQPTQFDFILNLKTASALGLAIPRTVLLEATEVIQ